MNSKTQGITKLIKTDGMNLGEEQICDFVNETLLNEHMDSGKVLLIPPDYTRGHSFGGEITRVYYELLKEQCEVDILPALGTHLPLTNGEIDAFFGTGIPKERFKVHDWRNDVTKIGEVPADFVWEATGGLFDKAIDIEINSMLLDERYDMIVSIGQVVPHVIAGMANYSKNILVGCGGQEIINQSHFIGAVYGMEKLMGRADNPVRRIFDYAQKKFLDKLGIVYVLTVTSVSGSGVELEGIYAGKSRKTFEQAAEHSVKKNIFMLDKPAAHIVAYLDEEEFKSTWLGNKAIYRTRMAIADGGKLTILAPGVKMFGEDGDNDKLIRKYGYSGRDVILSSVNNDDMKTNLSAAAHLIHGSVEGRFEVEYAAAHLTKEEVKGAGYTYIDYEQAAAKYDISKLEEGYNTVDGEEIYFIKKPALGLWAHKGLRLI